MKATEKSPVSSDQKPGATLNRKNYGSNRKCRLELSVNNFQFRDDDRAALAVLGSSN